MVIYDLDLAKVESNCSEFYKVFSVHDGTLYEERYNLLNAYLATVPGNYAFNLRRLLILTPTMRTIHSFAVCILATGLTLTSGKSTSPLLRPTIKRRITLTSITGILATR